MFVIIAKKVQQAMQREHAELTLERVTGLDRLTGRNPRRDHDIAQHTGFLRREREHVGCAIFAAESPIEGADSRIGDEGDAAILGVGL